MQNLLAERYQNKPLFLEKILLTLFHHLRNKQEALKILLVINSVITTISPQKYRTSSERNDLFFFYSLYAGLFEDLFYSKNPFWFNFLKSKL